MLRFALALLTLTLAAEAQTVVRTVPVDVDGLIYDATSGRLYGTVPERLSTWPYDENPLGNSVVAIDPVSGAVVDSLTIGDRLGPLAVSDDGTTLYVGVAEPAPEGQSYGAHRVDRIDVATWRVVDSFELGTYSGFDVRAVGLAVQPGAPDVLAVGRRGWVDRDVGVAVYENGVMRPDTTADGGGLVVFGDDPARLYSVAEGAGHYRLALRRHAVGAAGVERLSSDDLYYQSSAHAVEYADGLLYTPDGKVVNAEARRAVRDYAPAPLGRPNGVALFQAVEPAQDVGRTLFLTAPQEIGAHLVAYDDATEGWLAADVLAVPPRPDSELVRWSETGFAFAAYGAVVLVETGLLADDLVGFHARVGEFSHEFRFGSVTDTVRTEVTVSNPGTAPLRVDSVTTGVPGLTFSPSAFEVPPGGAVVGTATLAPTIPGRFDGELTFVGNAYGGDHAVPVSGTAYIIALVFAEAPIEVGPMDPKEVVSVGVEVENLSNPYGQAAEITSVTASSGPFTVEGLPFTVASGDSRYLAITVDPDSAGVYEAELVVESNAISSPDTLRIRAEVRPLAYADVSPFSVNLGEIEAGVPVDTTVTVHNAGSDTLRVRGVPPVGPVSFAPSAFEVLPGDSLVATVRVLATESGAVREHLQFESNARFGGSLYVRAEVVGIVSAEGGACEGSAPPDGCSALSAAVYPNPASALVRIRVELGAASPVRADVLDVLGRRVAHVEAQFGAGPHTLRLDVSGLPAGRYVVRASSNGGIATVPLTVVR